MLDIQVTYDTGIVDIKLDGLGKEMPVALKRGLVIIAKGVYREAVALVNGRGTQGVTTAKGWKRQSIPAGGYPVPVRTGHLKQSLNWLKPGEAKSSDGLEVRAAENEVIIFDSASYAKSVHDGLGPNRKYGPRPFLRDALAKFRAKSDPVKILNEEVGKVISK